MTIRELDTPKNEFDREQSSKFEDQNEATPKRQDFNSARFDSLWSDEEGRKSSSQIANLANPKPQSEWMDNIKPDLYLRKEVMPKSELERRSQMSTT